MYTKRSFVEIMSFIYIISTVKEQAATENGLISY